VGSSAVSTESYNRYRIVAKDLGLGKPWEEPGKKTQPLIASNAKLKMRSIIDDAIVSQGEGTIWKVHL
jgi:hypothetical protein